MLRYAVKAHGNTGNVSIDKTSDNGNARLQVNGNVEATPPANNSNNRLLPTTDWIRTNTANLIDARTAYLGGSVAMQDCKPGQLPQGAFFGVTSKNLAGLAQNGFSFLVSRGMTIRGILHQFALVFLVTSFITKAQKMRPNGLQH